MPDAPAVACRCGKLNYQEHSAKAKAREHDQWRGTAASRGYDYNWSSKLQPMILRRDPICRDPFVSGCIQRSRIGDHVIPRVAGGTNSLEHNLQGVCIDCHNRKIALERTVQFADACACRIKTMASISGRTIVLTCAQHATPGSFAIRQWTSRIPLTGKG